MAVVREEPYAGHNFLVDLGDGESDGFQAGFTEVSGLETWVEVIEYRLGNDRDRTPAKYAGLNKTANVTLKRGIIGSLNLYRWFDEVRNGNTRARRTITVQLTGEDGAPVMTWKLLRAFPIKYAVGAFNAASSDVAVEELVLAYERLELE